ncbi:unnamed protein product [Protopolystoma xenopodis]|uniref:Uncharacterized protein n=1 Tax=Protopolystoma xenopodis TaxID=117903 RepID=A0A3S5BEQ0_9PLAT|nr:unnamed protein product [Protopolystoma xenopodis]
MVHGLTVRFAEAAVTCANGHYNWFINTCQTQLPQPDNSCEVTPPHCTTLTVNSSFGQQGSANGPKNKQARSVAVRYLGPELHLCKYPLGPGPRLGPVEPTGRLNKTPS